MTDTQPDRTALRTLRPLEVTAYLRAHGWRETRELAGKGSVWTNQHNGDPYEILLPLDPELADYLPRLRQALETLALFEGRSPAAGWEDLTTSGADIVRAAVERPDADDGSLPLEDGVRLVEQTRDLLLAAACAAERPRPFFPGRKPERALEYLGRLRLGQTRRGSYVVTVLSPVPQGLAAGGHLFAELEEPFERRATRTLARALAAVQRAAERAAATGQFDVFEQSIAAGVSANLCQALAGMAGGARVTALRFEFSWSPTRPPPEQTPGSVRLPGDALPIIAEAGRIFRETSPQEEFTLRGMVIRLERPSEAATGVVTVLGLVEGQLRRVTVELGGADYDLAIRAHQDRIPVVCVGELLRQGRTLVLRNPRQLALEPVETLF